MISLKNYIIKEENEDEERSMETAIDIWIGNDESKKEQFYDLINFCLTRKTFSEKDLKEYLNGKPFERDVKSFVDFLSGEVNNDSENTDYYYGLKKIVQNILSNKSQDNKWTKRKTKNEN